MARRQRGARLEIHLEMTFKRSFLNIRDEQNQFPSTYSFSTILQFLFFLGSTDATKYAVLQTACKSQTAFKKWLTCKSWDKLQTRDFLLGI